MITKSKANQLLTNNFHFEKEIFLEFNCMNFTLVLIE
jgi:hypothetical protein